MKRSVLYGIFFLIASCIMCKVPFTQAVYIASTPADPQIRRFLSIPQKDSIEFIRWYLTFVDQDSFAIEVNYGIGQPNTSGFMRGGKHATVNGRISKFTAKTRHGYTLEGINGFSLQLVTINKNLLHILAEDESLLAGNDGWNYTLTKKSPEKIAEAIHIPSFTSGNEIKGVYAGRTPCSALTQEYNIEAPRDCLKLKWLLTLNRDVKTNEPSSFSLNYTLHRSSIIDGTWKIDDNNILTLYDKGKAFLNLLAADKDVLFFIDKQNRLFKGNEDFSYAINKR